MTSASMMRRGAKALLHEPTGGDPDKLTLVRALGSLVWDDNGKEYIDCTAQAWSNNLGANDPRVIAAADAAAQPDHPRAADLPHPRAARAGRADHRHRAGRARPGRVHPARLDGGGDGLQARDAQPTRQPAHPRPAGRIPRPIDHDDGRELAAPQQRLRPAAGRLPSRRAPGLLPPPPRSDA